MKILVVGAGFSGATIANLLAEAGHQVDIIDQRGHLAGNAFDEVNELGIRTHKYGPHLFHTSNKDVVSYLSRFTSWIPYNHRVKAMLSDGRLVTLPVNRETANIVGKENVIDTFYRPYSRKMWGLELEDIDASVLSRVPIRDDLNELYFPDDTFQALPEAGYTQLVKNMLNHQNISIFLNEPFRHDMLEDYDHVFNSMSIDEFFGYRFGRLPYRSIKFHKQTLPVPRLFPVSVVNFTHNEKFTRVTEWKNLPGHGDNAGYTTVTFEEPCADFENDYERYYPVKDPQKRNRSLFKNYAGLVPHHITFIGRCGLYAYLDMHQAINSAKRMAGQFLRQAA